MEKSELFLEFKQKSAIIQALHIERTLATIENPIFARNQRPLSCIYGTCL